MNETDREPRAAGRLPSAVSRARLVRPRRVPRPAGLRAGSLPDVQLVAGAGPYEVDVLVRVLPAGGIEIVGQITGSERLHEPVCRLPLGLYDADALACVARTETDHFGEFEMKGLGAARYVLALGAEPDAPCMAVWEGGRHAATCEAPV